MRDLDMIIALLVLAVGGYFVVGRIGHFMDKNFKKTYAKQRDQETKVIWNRKKGYTEVERDAQGLPEPEAQGSGMTADELETDQEASAGPSGNASREEILL